MPSLVFRFATIYCQKRLNDRSRGFGFGQQPVKVLLFYQVALSIFCSTHNVALDQGFKGLESIVSQPNPETVGFGKKEFNSRIRIKGLSPLKILDNANRRVSYTPGNPDSGQGIDDVQEDDTGNNLYKFRYFLLSLFCSGSMRSTGEGY
jgi:hypothetical protein